MADISKRVMDMVRREMAKNPDIKSGPLYEMARKLDRSIRSLTLRQFHARYPLQVKRTEKLAARKGRPARKLTRAGKPRRKPGPKPGGRAAKKTPKKPVTRRASGASTVRKTVTPQATGLSPATNRDAVRKVLLDFAGEVATADNKADMIAVIGRLDGWIDRLIAGS